MSIIKVDYGEVGGGIDIDTVEVGIKIGQNATSGNTQTFTDIPPNFTVSAWLVNVGSDYSTVLQYKNGEQVYQQNGTTGSAYVTVTYNATTRILTAKSGTSFTQKIVVSYPQISNS